MTTSWKSWNWQLGLAGFLAVGGMITYDGEYAVAQVVNTQTCVAQSNNFYSLMGCSEPRTIVPVTLEPGNPAGVPEDLWLQVVSPATGLTPQGLSSATVLTPQGLSSATVFRPQVLSPATFLTP